MSAINEYAEFEPWVKFGLLSEDEIYVTLASAQCDTGNCIEHFTIKWVPHFACGSLAPRIELEAGQLKFFALYPQILSIFLEMQWGILPMQAVLAALEKIGVREDYRKDIACCDEGALASI